ncbi:MAG: hypothetical protein WA688_02980 [Thermoplasmata archaeon]
MQLQPGEIVLAQQPTTLYSQYGRPSGLLVLTNVRLTFEMYSGGYLLPSVDLGLDKLLNAFPMAIQGDLIIDSKTVLTVDSVAGRLQFDLQNAAQWAQFILQARASVPPPPPPAPPPPPPPP